MDRLVIPVKKYHPVFRLWFWTRTGFRMGVLYRRNPGKELPSKVHRRLQSVVRIWTTRIGCGELSGELLDIEGLTTW
jgi:hypothetical protein